MSALTWSHLRERALAGRPVSESAAPDAWAHELLQRAGGWARAERAGGQPARGTGTTPLPPPPETLPAVGALGQQLLETMLRGADSSSLSGYYADLAARGLRVPHRLLAAVLAHAAQEPNREPPEYLPEVLGERGHWLARLHPAWRPLGSLRDEASWTHGTPEQRRAFLRARRRQDPAHARALLAASLPHDPPGLQADFLQDLAGHAAPADEPLLAPLLASPDPRVRQRAAGLLVQLPGSALVERIWT